MDGAPYWSSQRRFAEQAQARIVRRATSFGSAGSCPERRKAATRRYLSGLRLAVRCGFPLFSDVIACVSDVTIGPASLAEMAPLERACSRS
jgi:hypothetical protein